MVGGNEGADPASVVFDAVNAAKARGVDVLLIDTAGRLHNKKNLMEELRKAFGVVLQDTALFHATVFENIRYGRPEATAEQVKAAARTAEADGFIGRLPQGYDTVLSQGGMELSQGERQLLTIARAVLADAPILILDEATSSVDTVTEQKIRRAMLKICEKRTSVIIAHRLSTIRDSDLILLLENGEIAEQGTHGELMERNGRYAQMYRTQTELE